MGGGRPVALVTGGTRGIGLGIARRLARDGFDLMLNGRRAPREVEEMLREVSAIGAAVDYAAADIGESAQRDRLVPATIARFQRLDVLVNNAGIAPERRVDLLEASEESFERVLRVDLTGPYFLAQRAARAMLEQRARHPERTPAIINITSVSAAVASTARGEYCVAKAGLSMATRLFATRLAADGIAVYEIRPGLIATDMTAPVKSKYDRMIEQGLLLEPRWGTPDDVGCAVSLLARGMLPYAAGQVLTIDGGLMVQRL